MTWVGGIDGLIARLAEKNRSGAARKTERLTRTMLVLPEVLTMREANVTLQMLEQSMRTDNAATLTIDASPLRSFDSAAVALLLECRRQARASNKGFEVHGASSKLNDLVRLYGVESLLAFAPPTAVARSATL
jgi:phospholipid transport system transporter-binding protein